MPTEYKKSCLFQYFTVPDCLINFCPTKKNLFFINEKHCPLKTLPIPSLTSNTLSLKLLLFNKYYEDCYLEISLI